MALGSIPPAIRISVSIAVVVVLPWVPETATGRVEFPGDKAQHDRPFQRGDAPLSGSDQLRVVRLAGGGVDNHFRVADIFRFVAHGHRDSISPYPVQGVGFVNIGTGELVTLVEEDFGHGAHARAADAYKVQFFYVVQNIVVHMQTLLSEISFSHTYHYYIVKLL